jgi:hypothetical protein
MSDAAVGTAARVAVPGKATWASASGSMVHVDGKGRSGGSQGSRCAGNESRGSAIALCETRGFWSVAYKADKGKVGYGADHGVKVGKKMRIDKISEWFVLLLPAVCRVLLDVCFNLSPLIPPLIFISVQSMGRPNIEK